MTKEDVRILKELILTRKKGFDLHNKDSDILKCLVYNTALKDAIELVRQYQNGEIAQDVIENLSKED